VSALSDRLETNRTDGELPLVIVNELSVDAR
jgi:hypothetical protein